jgi:hypothetical protein
MIILEEDNEAACTSNRLDLELAFHAEQPLTDGRVTLLENL